MAEVKPTIYVETTIPSYLKAWPSSDAKIAEHQKLTQTWWENSRPRYDLLISDVVIAEIGTGDPNAAKERLEAVDGLARLSLSDSVKNLAADYMRLLQIPIVAAPDAFHLAFAVVGEIDYLLTWNCKHLANARVMRAVTAENTRRGLFVPL